MPTLSVGMPVYNGERYLESAIQSVLDQTYDDFELIIADNASTDRSADICRDFAAQDARIRYLRNEQNIGAAANYNLLFQEAQCEFFRWNNSDDLLEPTLHEKCYRALRDNPDAVLAAGTTVLINDDGAKMDNYVDDLHIVNERPSTRFREFFDRVGLTNVIYGLMRKTPLGKTELMGDGSIPTADIVFMAHLVLQGKFIVLDEPLFYRRMHEQSSSADRDDMDKQASFWNAGTASLGRAGWKRIRAYRRAVANTSLPTAESVALYKILVRMLWDNRLKLSAELIRG